MPIYDYHCGGCGKRVQVFFRTFAAAESAQCPQCHSSELRRLPSRVAQVRSESSYQDFLSDPSTFDNVDYSDPRAMAQWAQRMGEAAGLDVGDEYADMMEQMESGGMPDDALGGDDGDFGL